MEIAEQQYQICLRGVAEHDFGFRKRILEGLGDILLLRGDYEEAEGQFTKALEIATGEFDKAQIAGKLGELAFKRGNVEQASKFIETALELLGNYIPRVPIILNLFVTWEACVQILHTLIPRVFLGRRALGAKSEKDFHTLRLLSRLAYVYWFQKGKIPCAWAHLREMNLAERYPETLELAQAYSEHAPVMTMVPYFSRAILYAEKSYVIRRKRNDLWGQGQSLHFRGVALYASSQFEECIAKCREAARLLGKTGDMWEVNTANWHIAFSLYRLGRLKEAIEMCRQIYQMGKKIGDQQAMAISLSCWSKASDGQVPKELIRHEMERNTGDVHSEVELVQGEAVRLQREGRSAEAVDLLRKIQYKVLQRGFQSEYIAPIFPWYATALRHEIDKVKQRYASQETKILIREFDRATHVAVKMARKYRNNLPHALRERAVAHALYGRNKRSISTIEASLRVADELGSTYEMAQTLLMKERLNRELGISQSLDELAVAHRLLSSFELAVSSASEINDKKRQRQATLSLVDRFDTLIEVGRDIANSLSSDEIFRAIQQGCKGLFRGEKCVILRWNEAESRVFPLESSDANKYSEEMALRAFSTRRPIVFVEGDPEPIPSSLALSGVRSALFAPFFVRGKKQDAFI